MERRELFNCITAYLESHLQESPTLDKLEGELHYSKFYLNRIFREMSGKTIGAYVRARRLTEAARSLVETDISIVQISLDAGYNSQQAFTGAFRQVYHCSPKIYRKRKQFYPVCPPLNVSVLSLYRLEGCAA